MESLLMSPQANDAQRFGASKKKIFEILKNFNENTVRREVNRIVGERRDIPPKEARTVKRLYGSEVTAILRHFA